MDIEFHRIGVDLIHELVKRAATEVRKRSPTDGGDDGGDGDTVRDVPQEASTEMGAVASIPRLDSAVFLVADRPRSTSELVDDPWRGGDADVVRIGEEPGSATSEDPPPLELRGLPPEMDPRLRGNDGRITRGDRQVRSSREGGNDGRHGAYRNAPNSHSREGGNPSPAAKHLESRRSSSDPVENGPATTDSLELAPPGGVPLAGDDAGPVDRPSDEPSESGAIAQPVRPQPEPLAKPVLPAEDAEQSSAGDGLECDAVLGVTGSSPQYGLLGEASSRKIALDLNQPHTISLFGVQGGGKSYTVGSVVEMACMPVEGVNALPHPLAGVVFHYSSTLDYRPEFTSMVEPNRSDAEVEALRNRYGASPKGLSDLVILAPAAKVEERRAEYPGIEVLPIAFAATELKASHWKFLMGAVGSQSMYIRQLTLIMKKLRGKLTLAALRQGVQDSALSDYLKDLALLRLQFAEDYIDDARRLTDILRPGRLVIVDLRDELIEKDEALGLFVVLLQMFAETTYQGRRFNKLVVFDEAHKYIDSPDLVAGLVEVVREMRHKGTSIMVASQDPPSVPTALIELSTQIILHKFNSPAWLKHIQKANAALDAITPAKLSSLGAGEACVWSSKATDDAFVRGAVKVRCRPRVTRHGGGTKTADASLDE